MILLHVSLGWTKYILQVAPRQRTAPGTRLLQSESRPPELITAYVDTFWFWAIELQVSPDCTVYEFVQGVTTAVELVVEALDTDVLVVEALKV